MNMIEVKTSDLVGPALDWAVAQIDGVKTLMMAPRKDEPKKPFALFGSLALSVGGYDESSYAPSTRWHCCGPLIEKHGVELAPPTSEGDSWGAAVSEAFARFLLDGETPLIAACRAIVAAKLGDTVSIPAELWRGEA